MERKTVYLVLAGTGVTATMTALSILSTKEGTKRTPVPQPPRLPDTFSENFPNIQTLPPSSEIPTDEESEWDCAPIPKGSWLTQELRRRGRPGIDPPPYQLRRRGGKVKTYESYQKLPDLVYPGETFCIKKDKGSSLIDPGKDSGTIYDRSLKSEIKGFERKSERIQASIRSKQGF